MPVLKADLGKCQGYANCVDAAPDTFDISDEGVVILLRETVAGDERARIEEAVRSCPVGALSIEDD